MLFGNDTQIALTEAAVLVNTLSDGVDELETCPGWIASWSVSDVRRSSTDD